MSDQCQKCQRQGDIQACLTTACSGHESRWKTLAGDIVLAVVLVVLVVIPWVFGAWQLFGEMRKAVCP